MTRVHAPITTPVSVDDPLMIDLSVFPQEVHGTAILSHNTLFGRWKWNKDNVQMMPLPHAKLTEIKDLYKELRPGNDALLQFILKQPEVLEEVIPNKALGDIVFFGTIRVRQPWIPCVRLLHFDEQKRLSCDMRSLDKTPRENSVAILLR